MRRFFRRFRVLVYSEADALTERQLKVTLPPIKSPAMVAVLQVLRAEYATWSQLAISPDLVGTPKQHHASGGACAVADLIALLTDLSTPEKTKEE